MVKLLYGIDAIAGLESIEENSIHSCVTSPPYWGLRDYGTVGQTGLEATPEAFVQKMVDVFRAVRRVLRADGTLWVNLGDSYAGAAGGFQGKQGQRASRTHTARIDHKKVGEQLKPKDLVGIPWMVAFALRADGWFLRQDIIWSKPNPMPESVRDRCTKSHEYIFLLSKSSRYYYNAAALREPATYGVPNSPGSIKSPHGQCFSRRATMSQPSGWDMGTGSHKGMKGRYSDNNPKSPRIARLETRNKRSVWNISTTPYKEAHFATFPREIPRLCILAGTPPGGVVLDPFSGSATTGEVAVNLGRKYVGIDINLSYLPMAKRRLGLFAQ